MRRETQKKIRCEKWNQFGKRKTDDDGRRENFKICGTTTRNLGIVLIESFPSQRDKLDAFDQMFEVCKVSPREPSQRLPRNL